MADTPSFMNWLAHLFLLPAEVDEMKIQLLNLGVTVADYAEEIAAINAETDNLSARIDAVLASLDIDDPAVEAELQAIANRLKGLAADPENPVPDEGGGPVEEPATDQPAQPEPAEGEQPQG